MKQKDKTGWIEFEPTFTASHAEKNPNRKWYQFWKPKYIWVENPKPKAEYKQEGKIVKVRIGYDR